MLWWQNAPCDLEMLLCYPGLAMVTDREMAILQLEQVTFPEDALAVIEVSQTRSGDVALRHPGGVPQGRHRVGREGRPGLRVRIGGCTW